MRYLIIFLTANLFLYGFSDSDLDGVDDSIDLCPNTPFDVLVDKNGCDLNKSKDASKTDNSNKSYYNIEVGLNNSLKNFNHNNLSTYISMGYSFNNYYLYTKLSTYKLKSKRTYEVSSAISKTFQYNKLYTTLTLGLNSYFNNAYNKKNDYYTSLALSYVLNEKSLIYFNFNYTYNGHANKIKYKNYVDFSIGYSYFFKNNLSIDLSLNYESKIYKRAKSSIYSIITLNYYFNKKYYLRTSYLHYFRGNVDKNFIGLSLGVNFE